MRLAGPAKESVSMRANEWEWEWDGDEGSRSSLACELSSMCVYCVLCTVYCVLYTMYCVLCTKYGEQLDNRSVPWIQHLRVVAEVGGPVYVLNQTSRSRVNNG